MLRSSGTLKKRKRKKPNGYLLDTLCFTFITDRRIQPSQFPKEHAYFVTHIQKDEIQRKFDEDRRKELLSTFHLCNFDERPLLSAVTDISRVGNASISDLELLSDLRESIRKCELAKHGTEKDIVNISDDALIAEVAIKEDLTLVTSDRCLNSAVNRYKKHALIWSTFQKRILGIKLTAES